MKNILLPLLSSASQFEQVLKIIDIVWLVAFIAVLVLLGLMFLRGFFRGWKYGTYRLIFLGILIAVALVTLGSLSNFAGNLDVSGFGLPALTLEVKEGTTITSTWTTPLATLTDFFDKFLKANGVTSDASAVLSYAFALALSVVKLFLILIEAIIIATIGQFLAWLFWIVIFRNLFVKKDQRKVKKLKLVSGFEEVIVGGVLLAMMLMPFTSIVNAISNHAELEKEQAEKNETTQMIYAVLDSYQNSLFSKVFFSWTKFDGSETIDTRLASFITQVNYEGIETDLIHELGTFAEVGSGLVNDGLFSAMGTDGMQWALILGTSMLPNALNNILSTDLVQTALPVAMELALNLDDVKSVLGEDTVKWLSDNSVDWNAQLGNVASLYRKLLDADIFDMVLPDTYSQSPIFDLRQLYKVFSSDESQTAFHDAMSIADNAVVNHLLAGLMYTMSTKEDQAKDDDPSTIQLVDFLPHDESGAPKYDEMAELSWFSELTIVFDTVHEMVGIDAEQTKGIFDELPSNAGAETKSKRIDASSESSSGSGIFSEAVTDKLTNFIFDHAGDLIDCLIGARDANGEPTGVDAKTGISTGDSKNFLDSALVYNALPSLVPLLQETMNEADLQVDLASAQTALMDTSSSCLRVNFKREFGAMLDFVGNLTATDAGKAFLKNLDSLAGIEFDPDGKLHSIDPDLVSTLKDALKEIDESEILGLAVPQISERMVTNAVDLSSYGLNKLDFYCDNFGEELGKLLSLAVDCKHVLRDFVGASDSFSIDAVVELAVQEKDEFIVLLEALAGSAILNPVDKDDGVANKNFCNLLNTVFSKISSDIEQFTPDKLEGVPLVSTRNEAGEITAHGECSLIVEVLFDLASSGVVNDLPNLSGASASEAIKVIQKLDIHDLFSDIGASKVFSTIGGSLLDGFLSKIIGASELGLGEKVTFKNVKTQEQWTNEANALQAIVDLAANGLDLSNFDFFKDGAQFGPLLKALAKSNMFMYGDEYCFPQYLYNKMLASVDSSTLQYFADDGVTSDQLSAATTLEQKKALCLNLYADMVTGLPNQSDWAPDTGVGEIDRINAFLLDVSRMGGIDALTSFSADKLNGLRNALVDVASSEAFGRTILMNGLNKGISSINAGDEFDFTAANTSYFAGDGIDAAKRVAEVNTLMDAFEVIYDPSYGIANGTSFDSSKLNLANLSVDFFLRPALEGFSESQVLSTVKEGSTKTSVHKQIICLMLRKAGLYTVTEDDVAVNPGYSEKTIRQIVDGVTDWDTTTDDLCDAVSALQSSALVKDGELNFNAVSDPAKYFGPDSISREEKAAELRLIFGKMNSCELTYRALPERLYSALQTVDDIIDGDFDGGFIKAANPYFMAQGTDLARYPDEEIDRVVQCFADISRVQNMNPNDISTINPVTLTDLLDHMSYTGLFNSPKEAGKLTAFQELLVKVVGIDQLGEYLYYAASPKDIANKTAGNYDDYEKKASYIVKTVANARYDASAAELSAQSALLKGESASLRSLLALFVSDEMKSLLAGGTMTFQDLSPNSLARMLSELNDNAFFYDCVPNILAKLGADSATFNIAGVDLTLGNYFFAYYYNADGSTKGSPDYSAHYTDDEIYNVASLFNLIKKTQSTLGGSFNLKDIDMVSLKHLLLDLNNSVVFHNEGRRDPCLAAESVAYSGDALNFNDLTVFEQIIYQIYDKASIAKLTYDPNTDLSLYLEHQAKGYKIKKHNEIASYDQDEWLNEINDLTDLVTTIQTSSLVDSSGNITMDVDSLKALPPSELMAILDAINEDDFACEAIQISLRDLFANIGLDDYSTYTLTVSGSAVNEYTPSLYATSGLLDYSVKNIVANGFGGASSDVKVYADIDGDGTYDDDVTTLCAITVDGTDLTVDCSEVYCAVKLSATSTFSVASVTYDMCRYYYGQDAFRDSASGALLTLLNSFTVNGTKPYFEFTGSGTDMANFRSEGYSTYGLLDFFRAYPAYALPLTDAFLPSASATTFTAAEYTFYQLMTIQASLSGLASVDVQIGSNIGNLASTKADCLARLKTLWSKSDYDSVKEATWFDAYVIDAATLALYNTEADSLTTGSTPSKSLAQTALLLQRTQMKSLVASLSNDDDHSGLYLAPEIMSGLLQNYVRVQLAWTEQNDTYLSKGLTLNSADRADMANSVALPYGTSSEYDYSITYAHGTGSLSTMIAATFDLQYAIGASDWTSAAALFATLDGADAAAVSAVDLSYLGLIYDLLLAQGKFTVTLAGSIPTAITDLPSPNVSAANNYTGALTPAVIAAGSFYSTVAGLL